MFVDTQRDSLATATGDPSPAQVVAQPDAATAVPADIVDPIAAG